MVMKLRFTYKLLNNLTTKLIKKDPVPQNCLFNSLRNYYLHSDINADGANMSELLMPYNCSSESSKIYCNFQKPLK